MNELINVDFSGERPAVSARELHEFLGVETRFNDWLTPSTGRRPLHRHGQGDLYATAQ